MNAPIVTGQAQQPRTFTATRPGGPPQGSSRKTLTVKAKGKGKGKRAAHKPEHTPTQLQPTFHTGDPKPGVQVQPKHGPNELGLTPQQIAALGPEGAASVAAAIVKYGGALKGVGDQTATATAHGHALDPLYQAFGSELARIQGEQAGHVADAQRAVQAGIANSHNLEGQGQQQIISALAGRTGGGDIGAQLAAQVGGQAAAGGVGLDRIGAIDTSLIGRQGQASADMLSRIGAIAQGAKAQHVVENQNVIGKLLGDKTELLREAGSFITADAADRGAAHEKNLIDAAAVDQRNAASLRDYLLGKSKIKAGVQMNNADNQTNAAIAGTKAGQAANELAAKVKHWAKQDDAALIRASKTGTGGGAKAITVHRADGATIKLTASDVKRWRSYKSKLDGAVIGAKGLKGSVSDTKALIGKIRTGYGLSPAEAAAVVDLALNGHISPAEYKTLASRFSGGVVPKGYWIHASAEHQAQMHGG